MPNDLACPLHTRVTAWCRDTIVEHVMHNVLFVHNALVRVQFYTYLF